VQRETSISKEDCICSSGRRKEKGGISGGGSGRVVEGALPTDSEFWEAVKRNVALGKTMKHCSPSQSDLRKTSEGRCAGVWGDNVSTVGGKMTTIHPKKRQRKKEEVQTEDW